MIRGITLSRNRSVSKAIGYETHASEIIEAVPTGSTQPTGHGGPDIPEEGGRLTLRWLQSYVKIPSETSDPPFHRHQSWNPTTQAGT